MLAHLRKKFHHYFLPHESNNFRARTLQNSAIIFYIILLVTFQTSLSILKQVKPNILGYATDITVEKILNLVNKKRTEANLPPLVLSDELTMAATQKAQDMFSKNYWAHVSPTGITPWAFINSVGYEYIYAGENLARNFSTADEVVEAWMNSTTHRANILKPEYNDIGLAVVNGRLNGEDTTLVVQEFGTSNKSLAEKKIPTQAIPGFTVENKNQLAEMAATDKNLADIKPVVLPNPFISKTFSLLVAEFLLVILFIDSIYLWRSKTERLGSHSLAHIIFIAALIGAMGATGIGVIL